MNQGADLLDIGGESTRPGSTPTPVEEEFRRVLPVIKALVKATQTPLSIDTWRAELGMDQKRCSRSIGTWSARS